MLCHGWLTGESLCSGWQVVVCRIMTRGMGWKLAVCWYGRLRYKVRLVGGRGFRELGGQGVAMTKAKAARMVGGDGDFGVRKRWLRALREVAGWAVGIWGACKVVTMALCQVSCVASETGVFISQAVQREGTECAYGTGKGISVGVLDLAFRDTYEVGLMVGNQLVAGGSGSQALEVARFRARSAKVRLVGGDGRKVGSFSVPVSGMIEPGKGSGVGWGVVGVTLVSREQGEQWRKGYVGTERSEKRMRVVANVEVSGETLGGREITTAEFGLPIDVCDGCLVEFPAAAVDLGRAVPNCGNLEGVTSLKEPCVLGQDDAVDCRLCQVKGVVSGVCLP